MCHRRKSPPNKEDHERGTESQEINFLFACPKLHNALLYNVTQMQLLIYMHLGLDALHFKTNVLLIRPHIMESDYSFEVGNGAQFDESVSHRGLPSSWISWLLCFPVHKPDTTHSWQRISFDAFSTRGYLK